MADALRARALVAPAHVDGEVYAAMRRLDRRGVLRPGLLDEAVRALTRLPMRRVPLAQLLPRAHALGTRFTPRDCFYVAAALRIGAELLTRDEPLARACDGLVRVRLV